MTFSRLLVLCPLVFACSAQASDAFESEPVLKAPLLVQAPLLSGPDFRVVPEVAVRGYMANFLIDTKFGPMRADSVEMLANRIGELPAMEALDEASRSGAFATALAARAKKPGSAIVNVVTHPVDSITGLPRGVARYRGAPWDKRRGRAQPAAARHGQAARRRAELEQSRPQRGTRHAGLGCGVGEFVRRHRARPDRRQRGDGDRRHRQAQSIRAVENA